MSLLLSCFFFFFNDTATTEIYTLSLHDALPIFPPVQDHYPSGGQSNAAQYGIFTAGIPAESSGMMHEKCPRCDMERRSEEHTSELQSRQYLVCRLLLEKKKIPQNTLLLRQHTTL